MDERKILQSWRLPSGKSQPKALASSYAAPKSAALCINFLGLQPTLAQVPPNPQVVPMGVGWTKLKTATLGAKAAGCLLAANPPDRPPIKIKS